MMARERHTQSERILQGLGVSSGVAIGQAHVRESDGSEIIQYAIPATRIGSEISRLEEAINQARAAVRRSQRRAAQFSDEMAEDMELLFEVHLRILDEGATFTRNVENRIRKELVNVEYAVAEEVRDVAATFASMKDKHLAARAEDIREIGKRLMAFFTRQAQSVSVTHDKNAIIIADEMTPADAISLNPDYVIGVATNYGGPESHTAIVTRAMGIPSVLGAKDITQHVRTGETVIVDGKRGRIIVNPSEATLRAYTKEQQAFLAENRRLSLLRDQLARTKDGTLINLLANIETEKECDAVLNNGAEGVGLLRSEFLYMNREDIPDEEEQTRFFTSIIKQLSGKPVTIRTLDVGGEKLSNSLVKQLKKAENPALGLRAIRFSLKFPQLLEDQFCAILRASLEGEVRILLPMISSLEEIHAAREILRGAAKRLQRRGVSLPSKLPPVGAMIEVPAAAMAVDYLVNDCDFLSIGTNDLTMYTLAIDRGDQEVASLYNPLHPALLQMIRKAGDAGWNHGLSVAVCGEMAGNPDYSALLVGLGIHELSMSPLAVPRVKDCIRRIDTHDARRMVSRITEEARGMSQMRNILDEYNKKIFNS